VSQARRGERPFALPTGYVWGLDGQIPWDPDEQVQQVVRLIFQQLEVLGTLGGLLGYLARHDIGLGVRVREGPSAGKGQLVWRRPKRMTVQNLLKPPLYAGADVYGRCRRLWPVPTSMADAKRTHAANRPTIHAVAG
jgi:hypothetical protein